MQFSESDVADYLINNDYYQKIEELAEVRNVNVQIVIEDVYDHLNHNIKAYYRLSKHYMTHHCSSAYVVSLASRVLDVFYAKEVEGTARGFPIPGN